MVENFAVYLIQSDRSDQKNWRNQYSCLIAWSQISKISSYIEINKIATLHLLHQDF